MRTPLPALKSAAFTGLALTTVGLMATALAGLAPQAGPLPSPLVLSLGQSHAANAALAATPPDLEAAKQASQAALTQAPYDSSARLRLAYLDSLDGELSAEGVSHLERSYELLPLDQYVATWRVGFALEQWATLSPDLRSKVEGEALVFLRTSRRREMVATLDAVSSPTGVVPAVFWRERTKRPSSKSAASPRKLANAAS